MGRMRNYLLLVVPVGIPFVIAFREWVKKQYRMWREKRELERRAFEAWQLEQERRYGKKPTWQDWRRMWERIHEHEARSAQFQRRWDKLRGR